MALTQIDNLNSELAAAMAERFRLWEDKIKSVEAKTANQEMRVSHLEEVLVKLNTAKVSARPPNEK